MTPPIVTSLYAGVLVLILVGLSMRVIRVRRGQRIGIGDGNDEDLARRIRAHRRYDPDLRGADFRPPVVPDPGGEGVVVEPVKRARRRTCVRPRFAGEYPIWGAPCAFPGSDAL
jgi:hypothetical protein